MEAQAIRRNRIERVLLPSDSWVDRHPGAALVILAVLIVASGAF